MTSRQHLPIEFPPDCPMTPAYALTYAYFMVGIAPSKACADRAMACVREIEPKCTVAQTTDAKIEGQRQATEYLVARDARRARHLH